MRKVASGFLLKSSSTHARRGPASFLSYRFLATEECELAKSEGAFCTGASETRKAALEKKKAPRWKTGCCEQNLRHTEGLLPPQMLTVKAKTRSKAKIAAKLYAEDSAGNAATEKATSSALAKEAMELREICTLEAESGIAYESAAVGKPEELASWAKPSADGHSAQEELTEIIAKLDLSTYSDGLRWEKVARRLLDKGISLAHVAGMLKKCRTLRGSTRWVDSTVENCAQLGMSQQEMGRVFSKWPTIVNVTNDTFKRKVEFFESIGIDRHTLGKFLYVMVMTLTMSVSNLQKKFDFWEDYMKGAHPNAFRIMLSKNPELLAHSLPAQKLAWLEAQEFDKKWLVAHSSFLSSSLPLLISKAQVLESFGILDARKRARVLVAISGTSIPKLQARFENLLDAGFSRDQVQDIVMKSPIVLACTEDHVNLKIRYLFNVINASVDAILSSPGVWTHNLETRIKYRYEVIKRLQRLGVLTQGVSLGYMVCMTNANFNSRFVERLEDAVKQADALRA